MDVQDWWAAGLWIAIGVAAIWSAIVEERRKARRHKPAASWRNPPRTINCLTCGDTLPLDQIELDLHYLLKHPAPPPRSGRPSQLAHRARRSVAVPSPSPYLAQAR
jgi:hypothetical protein